jgi:hypothetical protein
MVQVVLIVVSAIKPCQLDSKLLFGCPRARAHADPLVPVARALVTSRSLNAYYCTIAVPERDVTYSSRVDSTATGRPSFPLAVDLFLQASIDYLLLCSPRFNYCTGSVTCLQI